MSYARVIINISAEQVDRAFTYRIPEALKEKVRAGARVKVPFGSSSKPREAMVIELAETADFEESRIKDIVSVSENAVGAESLLIETAAFLKEEYGCTMNQALQTVLPVKAKVRKNSRRFDPVLRLIDSENAGTTETSAGLSLNDEQKSVADSIAGNMRKPSLIYGITGSGKTRIYIELIRRARLAGKKTIMLIPEISLTYQTVNELYRYLGDGISILHSKLSKGERYDQYLRALNGEADVCIGPRSALFTPFKDLGLIIIDEEHEKTYRSETSPRYDARIVAEKIAEMTGAKLVLGSATPSMETYRKALSGIYDLHILNKRAHPGSRLPEVHVADMREEMRTGNKSVFSDLLKGMIADRLDKKEQVMLFLNRRGYAGFVSCRSCGHVMKCPHCDVSLTAHNEWYKGKKAGAERAALLRCHYCGHTEPMPAVCPECGSRYIAPFGVGTQKLEQAVKKTFPGARVLRMDADTTSSKNAHEKLISAFKSGEADILIGTQMIVKGHDFENVTLVGIVAADMSLNTPDYDSAERTFQLITQASGRSGRGDKKGDVVIQTYDPSHYAIKSAVSGDFPSFYEREMSFRTLLKYPPVEEMLIIRLRSADEATLNEAAEYAASFITERFGKAAEIVGPCDESIYKIKDYYRKIIFIKNNRHDIIIKIRTETEEAFEAKFTSGKVFLSTEIR